MRIWTIHPKYLDKQGLVALWREALLAQAVLLGKTKGYRNHPQLNRFLMQDDSVAAIATYLKDVHHEANQRGYRFDGRKIHRKRINNQIIETNGQLLYEWDHLMTKLKARSPDVFREYEKVEKPIAHPIFRIVPGKIRDWENQKEMAEKGH
jgi:hypothetical protein